MSNSQEELLGSSDNHLNIPNHNEINVDKKVSIVICHRYNGVLVNVINVLSSYFEK